MLNQLKRTVFKTCTLLFMATPAFADPFCLRNASNSELVNELEQRFREAGNFDFQQVDAEIWSLLRGPGGGGSGATITYNCNSRGNMNIAVVSPSGSETVVGVNMYDVSYCESQSNMLNYYRARATSNITIAICNSNFNLQRFSITPNGNITALSSLNVGDHDRCLSQAASINQF